MYQDLKDRIKALKEDADVEATATAMAQDASDFAEVEDEQKDEEVLEAVFYEDGEEEELDAEDLPEGEETVEEDGDEEEDGEDSPFDRDDVEVAEAVTAEDEETYGTFKSVAKKILKQQKKLGAIKSVSIKVLDLSESRKREMKKAGVLAAASLSLSAIAAAGVVLARKQNYGGQVAKAGNRINDRASQRGGKVATAGGYIKKGAAKVDAGLGKASKYANTKANSISNKKLALGAAGIAVAGAGYADGYYNVIKDFKTVLLEVTYKYGTKTFELFKVTKEEEQAGVPKKVLSIIKNTINSLKSKKNWEVKESATPALLKNQMIAAALTEAYLFEDDEAEEQPEEVVDPDQEIHDQEVTESTIGIFIEDADLDDEELDSDVPVDEDEDEELPVPGADSEEDEEELSETYFF